MKEKINRNLADRIRTGGIIVLVLAALLLSGCVSQENTKSAADSKTSAETGLGAEPGASNLLVSQKDFPGLTLKQYSFIAASESAVYNYTTRATMRQYKDVLPIGMRNVGQMSGWQNEAGKTMSVSIDKFDSNDGLQRMFEGTLQSCEKTIKSGEWKKRGDTVDAGCGQANIGDQSYYSYSISKNNPDVKQVLIYYSKGNYFVSVNVVDIKGESYNEAVELAKKVSGRLR